MAAPASAAFPTATLVLLGLSNFVVGMGAFLVIGILTPMAVDLGVTKAEAGLLMTIYAIVYALSSPLLVAFTGHVERVRVLVAGMAVLSAGALAAALAPSFPLLLVARALMALGGGVASPVAATIGVALVAPALRGRALALVFGGMTTAQVIGVPAGAWLGYTFGWRTAFEVVVVLGIATAAALLSAIPRGLPGQPGGLASLAATLTELRLVAAVAFTAFFIGGLYAIFTFIGPFLEARYALGRDGVTTALTIFGLGAVAGSMLGGRLTDRIGPTQTLVMLCVAQIVLMPIITLIHAPLAAAIALIALWSALGWAFMVAQQARLAALDPARVSVLFALNAAAVYVGASVGSAAGAVALDRFGLDALGPAGAAMIVVALASIALVARLPRHSGADA
ncbi:MAG: MFS transporter [Burkholderiales bacterium]|nr:MFS transporter [Burkholderiales bacterium]